MHILWPMTFQGDGPLDTSDVSGGGGGGGGGLPGGIKLGGGAVGIIGIIVAVLFGVNPGDIMGGGGGGNNAAVQGNGTDPQLQEHINSCTIQQANSDVVCRVVATSNSLNKVWPTMLQGYTKPKLRIFNDNQVASGCGVASKAAGPFYCPADQTVYINPSFYNELSGQLGGSNAPLAQEYVIAHEYGHHVEQLTGDLAKGQRMGAKGPTSGSVRIELKADCYAGVWASHADKGPNAMLKPLTQQDIEGVIQTAQAIGDDTLGMKNSDGWTHGSAEERVRWFTTGYRTGDPNQCDTFGTNDL